MKQALRIWLRVCLFFGIYVKSTQDDADNNNTPERKRKYFRAAPNRKHSNCLVARCRCIFRPQHLYIFLLTLMLCTLYAHGIHWRRSVPTLQLTCIVSVILFTFQLGTNLLIIMEAVCRHSQHTAFLQLLEQIEVCFKLCLRQDVQKSALLTDVYFLTGSLVAFSLITFALFMVTSFWINYIGFFWHGLWSILTLRVRLIQLLIYVRILQHYLQCLCAKLEQIVAYHLAAQRKILNISYERLASLEYLLAIGEVHDGIYKAFALLNYFAGWSLFGIVICYIFDMTCNIYWMLLSLDGFPNRQNYYIAGPLTFVPLVVIIGYLCYLCEKCKELVCAVKLCYEILKKMLHNFRVAT
ncbi:PREDICTED: putative gustatory receptor 39b [Rhagoletis zephyria]|uniref:putative gustatory receptor 39b n=1 Tax=Rhagoletis zephyria TaxID=28612 RepID=UPI0008115FB4|nr:PREDICTED: putative gustatory receptor 39b [Rhagoletis zephyria]